MSHPSSLLVPHNHKERALLPPPVTRPPALLPPPVQPPCNRDALIFADYMLSIQVEVTLRGRGERREGGERVRERAQGREPRERARGRAQGGGGMGLRSLVDHMVLRSAPPLAGP